jgi:hypothetical protein
VFLILNLLVSRFRVSSTAPHFLYFCCTILYVPPYDNNLNVKQDYGEIVELFGADAKQSREIGVSRVRTLPKYKGASDIGRNTDESFDAITRHF